MTLGEHLDELRWRLIRATIALLVAFIALYSFRTEVSIWIQKPYQDVRVLLNDVLVERYTEKAANDAEIEREYFVLEGEELVLRESKKFPSEMQSLRMGGPFTRKIVLCAWLSLFVAGPYMLWEIWMFIAAGLYKAERKVVYSYFPVSVLLFLVGVVFGFLVLFPAALYFTQVDGLGVDGIRRDVEFDHYLQLLRSMTLAIGVIFQLPIIQIALSRVGLVKPKTYASLRGHMAIIALIVAAILTPPDPVTQLILAGPAIVLWEVGIWVSRLAWREPEPIGSELEPTAGSNP